MTTWLTDTNNNKCSIEHFGTQEAAQIALDSLKDCRDCTNCSGCSGCSDCSGCSRCSDCSYKNNIKSESGANAPPPVPFIENIHQAVYAAVSAPDALEMSAWHTCGTTHCRAGWVVTLAGEPGKALEKFYNTELAAMLIYDESAPGFKISPSRFYDSNDDALADMKRLAEGVA